ncbi:MAG: hypothetical protein K0R15_1911 [Clostridiales bacterium]|jgi:signal transduction histidine kinase|nr:hypothetical protein [Clostridiales bacterium]
MACVPILIIIWGFIVVSNDYNETRLVSEIRTNAKITASVLSEAVNNTNLDIMKQEIENYSNTIVGRVLVINDVFTIIEDSNNLEKGKYLVSDSVVKALRGNQVTKNYKEKKIIEISVPIINRENQKVIGALLTIASYKEVDLFSSYMYNEWVTIFPILAILLLLFSIYYSGVFSYPFKQLSISMSKITEGHLDEKIYIKGHGEIEDIATAFNQMTSRLQEIEQSRQEFVSNVSHELKTPITSIKVLADSLLTQEDMPVEIYREFMIDITDEIDRENKIINDLLSLVKLNKTVVGLNIEKKSINLLFDQILKRLKPIAMQKNVELIFESYREVEAEIDEVKLSLALSNLIENGIKYNLENGWVKVLLNADHKFMFIKISDSGIGIPKESQEKIYDRFYRVDKARSRETGGTGLGLAITKSSIIMHNGSIKVHSEEDVGTTFSLRIPLYHILPKEIKVKKGDKKRV